MPTEDIMNEIKYWRDFHSAC